MAPILALTGFMGSGKTTVGRRASHLLGWDFLDLDAEVVSSSGRDIPHIFAHEGEAGFRLLEFRALCAVIERSPRDRGLILALGGGTVTDPDSLDLLRRSATVVYLDIDAEQAWQRVGGSDRPLARDRQAFYRLFETRQSVYHAAADRIVEVKGRSSEDAALEVVAMARQLDAERSGGEA